MTIRYKCAECSSVMKIRDELAGTKAKCPKCSTKFVVPAAKAAVGADEPDESPEDDEDSPDLPMDLTPEAKELPSDHDFDPMSVLDGPAGGGKTAAKRPVTAPPEAEKPSVAELMREFEESKKKKAGKAAKKAGLAEAGAAASAALTSGSAADLLSKTYDEKRRKASEPPPQTREERRASEEAEAKKIFAMKAAGVAVAVLLLGWMYMKWLTSETLPPLYDVTGVVMQEGRPLANVKVYFAPQYTDDGLPPAGPSTGITDQEGRFELMYDPVNYGAAPGDHIVHIESGMMIINLPDNQRRVTVDPDGDNEFEFSF